ncbi:hypothetical protein F4777DRAFT_91808 [Nemania sp. FL0916]|nr:hypothetical protein F4777DRAFT_91808 [Nemania sp. FL0916]
MRPSRATRQLVSEASWRRLRFFNSCLLDSCLPDSSRIVTRASATAFRSVATRVSPNAEWTEVPKLALFDVYNRGAEGVAESYEKNLASGHPMMIRNMPGLLTEQAWIDHASDPHGAFKRPRDAEEQTPALGSAVLKAIFDSAVFGSGKGGAGAGAGASSGSGPGTGRSESAADFEGMTAKFWVPRAVLSGAHPPLLRFREWLQTSHVFASDSLDKIIDELQEAYNAYMQPCLAFSAPLTLVRAIQQFNRVHQTATDMPGDDKKTPWSNSDIAHNYRNVSQIDQLTSTLALENENVEQFPLPRFVRHVGDSIYHATSCSIRAGIRPLRENLRRHQDFDVLIGQLAGYSYVNLVPPSLKCLDGQSLEFHDRVIKEWTVGSERFLTSRRIPLKAPPTFTISSQIWNRGLRDELRKSGDMLRAKLRPGDAIMVPHGWYFNIRHANSGLQLHSTATWFLKKEQPVDRPRDSGNWQLGLVRRYPPVVPI